MHTAFTSLHGQQLKRQQLEQDLLRVLNVIDIASWHSD